MDTPGDYDVNEYQRQEDVYSAPTDVSYAAFSQKHSVITLSYSRDILQITLQIVQTSNRI